MKPSRSTSGSGRASPPRMSSTTALASSPVSERSSTRSSTRSRTPNSRRRWSSGAYVSHGLREHTSAASPSRSSNTSMSHSSWASTPFQKLTTSSSLVHRRTTIHMGRDAKGCSAAARSPSLGRPSETMVTDARCPRAASSARRAAMSVATATAWAQSGVPPEGSDSHAARSAGRSSGPATVRDWGPEAGALRKRNSVGAPRAAASSPAWRAAWVASCQRVQATRRSEAPAATRRFPSGRDMLPLLSTIQ
mmetsp:Transcript_15182/g.51270  ORF Transcript_15182/g.51270 Transcript_15182/m.51270 type:complete len:250 (+) Transcript_15182:517-1266(+)